MWFFKSCCTTPPLLSNESPPPSDSNIPYNSGLHSRARSKLPSQSSQNPRESFFVTPKTRSPKPSPTRMQSPQPLKTKFCRSIPIPFSNNGLILPALKESSPITTITPKKSKNKRDSIHVHRKIFTPAQCKKIMSLSDKAAQIDGFGSYTYAKQTLQCRQHRDLFASVKDQLESVMGVASTLFDAELSYTTLCEPHIVKYDCTSKEKSKLEIHTDSSFVTGE